MTPITAANVLTEMRREAAIRVQKAERRVLHHKRFRTLDDDNAARDKAARELKALDVAIEALRK